MKKHIFLKTILAAGMLVLAGCSSKSASAAADSTKKEFG